MRITRRIVYPMILNIPITYKCNLKCKTCNIWKLYITQPEVEKEELDATEWIHFFERIGDFLFMLNIGGGEFILKDGIGDILQFVFKQSDIPKIIIITNGYESDRIYNLLQELLKVSPVWKFIRVNISCDGLESIHDQTRGCENVFTRVISLFRHLRELTSRFINFQVALSYTISSYNIGRLGEFWSEMRQQINLSPDEVCFNFQHYTYGFRVTNKEYDEMSRFRLRSDLNIALDIIRLRKSNDLLSKLRNQGDSFYLKKIIDFINDSKKMIIPCISPGNCSLYIEPDGTICPCGHWQYSLGNIRNNLEDVFSPANIKKLRSDIKKGECPNCWGMCEFPQNWLFNAGFLRRWK